MKRKSEFTPIHTILVPFVHNGAGLQALDVARHLDAEIILVGIVVVKPEESLSLQDHDQPVRFRNIWVRKLNQ